MRFAHTDDVTTTDAGTVEVLAPNLTGRVVDEDGRRVPGSDVWAERSDGTFHSHTIANEPDGAHGVFFGERRNQSTPDGTYVLTARAPLGCALLESEPVTVTYSGGTVSPSQVDLVLRRPPGWGDSPGEGWDVPVEADPDGTVNATVPTPAGEVTFDLQGVSGSGSLSASCVALPDELPVDAIDPPVDLGSTVDFEQATVCVPYTDAAVASAGLAESELALLHVDDADHVTDLTSQVDTSTNRICGVTPSFSRFLVGRAQDPAAHLSSGIHRWYGSNRFETAAAVSARSFEPGIPVAYLATGLTPDRIVVLGGPAVVSDQVVAQLGDHAPVTRRSGTDRYSTAAAVIAAAFPAQVETVVIATGDRYADALAGVPAAFRYSAPLIIVGENEIPETIADELERLSPRRILIFGGPNAVSTSVEQDLRSFVR